MKIYELASDQCKILYVPDFLLSSSKNAARICSIVSKTNEQGDIKSFFTDHIILCTLYCVKSSEFIIMLCHTIDLWSKM